MKVQKDYTSNDQKSIEGEKMIVKIKVCNECI